jgi:hypothetical protein
MKIGGDLETKMIIPFAILVQTDIIVMAIDASLHPPSPSFSVLTSEPIE